MSTLPDPYQVYQPLVPKKETPKQRAERVKQQIFAAESGAVTQHDRRSHMPPKPPNMKAEGVCVLDERGAHWSIGKHCPHGLLQLDAGKITEVVF